MDEEQARAALSGAANAQSRLAKGMEDCPPWRHALFGAVMAIFVGSAAVSTTIQNTGTVVAMLLVVLLLQYDRKRCGVFVNGYRKGATLPVTLVLLGAILSLMFAAMHAREAGLSTLTRVGITAIAFAIATAASVVWQRIYVRELREEAGK